MTLTIDVRHRQGAFLLDACLEVGSGLTALFGPSGSGKTTLINLVCGLIRPQAGRIVFDGEVWSDSERGIFLPVHCRGIGYVFQEGRLFPHMTVRDNLTYGTRFSPRAGRRENLDRVVALLGIGHLLDRRPASLSGGEKQRTALGRALMASPRLLLMDEPLSALDAARKAEILPDLERIRDISGVPVLYVSHSMEEVARLATRVISMQAGKAVAIGTPDDILSSLRVSEGGLRPGSFLRATVTGHREGEGLTIAQAAAGTLHLKSCDMPVGSRIRVHVPASDVILSTTELFGVSALNRLSGVIERIEDNGSAALVTLDCNGDKLLSEITRHSVESLGLKPGMPVHALFKTVPISPQGLFRETG